MQNKLYSTLANLYNEVKIARKDKTSLGDAIDDGIKNQQEVLSAREGFPNLKTKLDNICDLVSTMDVKYQALKADVFNIDVNPKVDNDIPVVNLDGKDFLVSLQNKIAYREDFLTIPPKEQRVIQNTDFNNMYDAYIKTDTVNSIVKSYDFTNDLQVKYDHDASILADKVISAKPIGDLYKLPLDTAKLYSVEDLDAAVLINMCSISSDYATPVTNKDGTMNYSNHLINSLRGNADWVVERSFLTVTVAFMSPTPIAKLINKQHSNTSICKVDIEVSTDGSTWTSLYSSRESEIEYVLPAEKTVNFIKYTYNCFDSNTPTGKLTISNIEIYGTRYNDDSGVVQTIDAIPMYEYDSQLKVTTTGATDDDQRLITKFALSNTMDNDNMWSTYIPKTYTILPRDFYDDTGVGYIGTVLKNNIKVDGNDDVIYTSKDYHNYTLTSVGGTLGDITISLEGSSSDTNSWKVDNIAYFKAYIKIKGTEYTVPLSKNNINKEVQATVGGYNIGILLSVLNNNVLRAFVYPMTATTEETIIKIDEIRIDIYCAYQMNSSTYTGNTSSVSPSMTTKYMSSFPINIFEISAYYRLYYNYFFSGFGFQTSYGTARSVSGLSGAIIPTDMKTSNSSMSTIRKSIDNNDIFNIVQIRNTGCSLPANIYMGYGGSEILYNSIQNDTVSIMRTIKEPVFTYKKEYKTKVFISNKGQVSKISVDQEVYTNDDIRYAISFDDLNYYVFNKDKLEWNTHYDNGGMSLDSLEFPNETFYDKIRSSEWLYIKVILNSPNAKLNTITVNFTNDLFTLINENEIFNKGMSKRHIEGIDPQSLTNFLRDDYSILKVASISKSPIPIFRYKLAGYNIVNYNDAQWERTDSSKVKEYLLPNNSIVFKNVSTATQYMKVVRRLIENQVAVIDTKEEEKLKIQEILDNEKILEDDIKILQQNITLLHNSILEDTPVPGELPSVMLPSITEIDVPTLKEGEFYKISDVQELRGIQVWEEQSSFVPYSEMMLFDTEHTDKYTSVGVVIKDSGAEINTDYDRDNPYMYSETGVINSSTKMTYPNFDLILNEVPKWNNIAHILDNGGSESFQFGFFVNPHGNDGYQFMVSKYSLNYDYTAFWELPGEDRRWVDIILDFRQLVWINQLIEVDFANYNPQNSTSISYYSYQITTFSYSLDGKEYIDIGKYTGASRGGTITFEKELRYLRIRCEVPYSNNRGANTVSFTEMDVYFSPIRYTHNEEFYIYNTDPIDTSKWLNFDQIKVDRFIDHNPAEMKFLLSDDQNRNSWKAWNGTKWAETTTIALSTAMSIETLLSLTKDQLNLLSKGVLYIAAIMKTTDGFKTPVLRQIEFIHDIDTEKYYRMVDLNTIDFKYSKTNKEILLTNNTKGEKKLKIVLL